MAALEARADYLDIQYSSQKISLLRSMSDAIKQAGRCFITDGGFHPGLPAFLVRYTAQSFESLVSARVCSVIKEDWKSLEVADSTIYELMELVNDFDMSIYKAGQWKRIGLISTSDYVSMDFRGEFGRQYCAPMLLEEMRALPDLYPTLQDTGFYVGGFNWFTDWVILPLAMISVRMWPNQSLQPMAKLMHWGLRTFSKPPFGTLLKIEAHGEKAGRSITSEITISHPDGYMFTAIPVAACIFQVLDGIIGAPGLWLQALVVDPNRFMSDMQRMGIRVNKTNGGADEMEPG